MTNLNFNEQEVMEILGKISQYGNVENTIQALNLSSSFEYVSTGDFIRILMRDGRLSESDAKRVSLFLEVNGRVQVPKFVELLNRSSM
mmetsp:Transcript_20146/g.14866  ORF Transcript_20146/g.14866 Transcript_20146/m.14866 type:complete len:88 (+) Transcript_20146:35-298(+)